jgi:hypothetical protein
LLGLDGDVEQEEHGGGERSASAWASEGRARTAGPRRKRACRTSRRSSVAAYGEEGRPLPPPRGAFDGVGRGLEGKRKDGCADRCGGTASRRCAAWRPAIGAGSGIWWWGTAVDSPMRPEAPELGAADARRGLWTARQRLMVGDWLVVHSEIMGWAAGS